jgi:hypothetical protein
MIEVQKRPEYQSALTDIVDAVRRISEYTKEFASQVTESTVEGAGHSEALKIAQQNTKELLENFANNYSLDRLIDALKLLGDHLQHDDELRNYLKELQDFVLSSLKDSGFIRRGDYIEHGSQTIQKCRHILLEKYHDITKTIADELQKFNEALQEDKTTLQWKCDFENLMQDIFLDEKGRPTVKFELIKDFGKALPLVAEKLKFLPLPRIENCDDQYEYIFDNIVLHVSDIVPKHLHISFTTDINLDREDKEVVINTGVIEISKLRADARNIAFFYKKKGGLITMKDVGLVDFAIPSDGLRVYLKLLLGMPNEKEPDLKLNVLEAETNINELRLRLHDTRHDFLYVFLTPLVEKRLKRQLENIITENLKKSVGYVQENLNRLQEKASETYRASRENRTPPVSGEKLEQKKVWESPAFGTAKGREE